MDQPQEGSGQTELPRHSGGMLNEVICIFKNLESTRREGKGRGGDIEEAAYDLTLRPRVRIR
ncbi:hypothetical protein [Burkholderia contaminans]|uniref:hypothetical protein n=1 Tax=Burkholderia contaminans TaxID=488447 RepID=UPI0015838BD1|nr:hypothetical protein [Burkholderia contaminans]